MIQVSTIDPLLPKETLQNKCNLSYVQLNITHTQYSNLASNAKMQPKPQVTVVLNSLVNIVVGVHIADLDNTLTYIFPILKAFFNSY